MQTKKFWIYNIIGSILWATTIILLGVLFKTYYEAIIDHAGKAIGILFVGMIIYLLIFKREQVRKYFKEKEQEILDKEEALRLKKKPEKV